jgi:hypothetical protein
VKRSAAARCGDESHLVGDLNRANGNAAAHAARHLSQLAPRSMQHGVRLSEGSDVNRATVVCRGTLA